MMQLKFEVILIAIILLFVNANVVAQSAEKGWQILFNGKDLTGWRELNGKHKWEVKDGVIVGTDVHDQPNGFLCTEKDFSDFILELEVSIDTLMNNSGVQFRSRSTADYMNGRVHGYQMEVDPKPQRWSGSIYDEGGRRNWLYTTELNVPGKRAFKNNQWNKYRIECFGTTMRTWVNGIPISHLVDAESQKGFIGLQLHANNPTDPPGGNQVRFRNIRIKTADIKPSPLDDIYVVNTIPNDLSSQEKKTGYSLLWDGKTTKGWRDAYTPRFPEKAWEIKDSSLNVAADSKALGTGRDIMTIDQFGAFILKFDFKLTPGANSGIKYFVGELTENKDPAKGNAVAALEYQIVDDSVPGLAPNRMLGSLADILPSQKTRPSFKKTGEWNQAIIKAFPDNNVEYWLNGYKILEYKRGSAEYLDLVSKSKYKDLPAFGMAVKGHILLEGRGGTVSYRSIKIKKLDKK
ncbi:MAG: 3-keto-disaccharide hydrolase [Segetibacter sp.]